MHRPRFALLLLCAVLAATAAPAVAGDDDSEKSLISHMKKGVDKLGAHFKIPTGGILPTGLKFRHKLPTGLKLPRLPKLPTGLKFPLHGKKHGRRLTTTTTTKFALPLPTGPKFVIPTGPKLVVPTGFKNGPLPGIIGGGRRLYGLKKFIPTGPIFVIPTGPKFVLPTGLKKFPGKLGRRMH